MDCSYMFIITAVFAFWLSMLNDCLQRPTEQFPNDGDMILVYTETYIENVNVTKQGNPIVYGNGSDLLTYRIDTIFHGTQTNLAMISFVESSTISQTSASDRAFTAVAAIAGIM